MHVQSDQTGILVDRILLVKPASEAQVTKSNAFSLFSVVHTEYSARVRFAPFSLSFQFSQWEAGSNLSQIKWGCFISFIVSFDFALCVYVFIYLFC